VERGKDVRRENPRGVDGWSRGRRWSRAAPEQKISNITGKRTGGKQLVGIRAGTAMVGMTCMQPRKTAGRQGPDTCTGGAVDEGNMRMDKWRTGNREKALLQSENTSRKDVKVRLTRRCIDSNKAIKE
jgi:hypothetical protein